ISQSTYVLSPSDSAHFELIESLPSSTSLQFSIEIENEGTKSSVKHEECHQFYMEESGRECYGDQYSIICQKKGEVSMMEYKKCYSTSPLPTTEIEEHQTTEGIERATEDDQSTTQMTTGQYSTTIETTIGSTTDSDELIDSTICPSTPTTPSTSSITSTSSTTTISPQSKYYASIVLEQATIHVEKSLDLSTKKGHIVFNVTVVYQKQPNFKIYVDTVEYVYNAPFAQVHHDVGESLNLTIAIGRQQLICVEFEVHSTTTTILELDDCPQFILEKDVNECRSSDLICICANSYIACPINGDPLQICSTFSPSPSSSSFPPSTESTSEGPLQSISTSPITIEMTTETSPESTESSMEMSEFPSTIDGMTSSVELSTSSFFSSSSTQLNAGPTSPSIKTTTTPKKSLEALSDLANTTVTIDNVSKVLEDTNEIVEIESEKMEGIHVYYVSEILFNAANVSGISQIDSLTLLDTLDECLNAPEQSFLDSANNHDQAPQKMLQTLPLLVVNTASERLFLSGNLLGFSSQKQACLDENEMKVFGLGDTGKEFIELSDGINIDRAKSSIEIPVDSVCGSSATHSFFSIHRSTKLFLGGRNYRRLAVKSAWEGENDDEGYSNSAMSANLRSFSMTSEDEYEDDSVTSEPVLPVACSPQPSLLQDQPVVSATILDNSDGIIKFVSRAQEKTQKMATVTIDMSGSLRPLHGILSFSWWNESDLTWSQSDLCQLREGQKGGKVIADCFHLTDFTLIVDGTVNDPCVCDMGLIIVGYVISAVSICSLFLVVFASIINRIPSFAQMKVFSFIRDDLFRNRLHSVDVLYTISLLFFYLIFTFFHDRSVAGSSCILFAVVSYSLLFCTVLLTLFQSYRTIATFSPFPIIRRILSFASHQIFVCTVSIGAPFLISAILAIVSNFFDRDDGFCWVRPDYITFAVVLPLSVLIVNGIICTILVVIRLYQEQKSQLMSGKNHLKRRIISVLIMQFTLGMPWVLQYFTLYAPTSTVFHYLFTIVNGSQGVVLLFLYVYRRERRMVSMRRRKGATIAARGIQAMEKKMNRVDEMRREEIDRDEEEYERSTHEILQ
ncbi:hypothetical protein PFISCL1PPCAC_15738, partial [Pristionchus fissidentatus]